MANALGDPAGTIAHLQLLVRSWVLIMVNPAKASKGRRKNAVFRRQMHVRTRRAQHYSQVRATPGLSVLP
jgi:hypothetical protein